MRSTAIWTSLGRHCMHTVFPPLIALLALLLGLGVASVAAAELARPSTDNGIEVVPDFRPGPVLRDGRLVYETEEAIDDAAAALLKFILPSQGMSRQLADAVVAEFAHRGIGYPFNDNAGRTRIRYLAAIRSRNCHLAETVLIEAYAERLPMLEILRSDQFLRREWRRTVLVRDHPEAAACSLAAEARFIDALIAGHGLPPRPYRHAAEAVSDVPFNAYSERNDRLMALLGMRADYRPAAALFAELALNERFIEIPDDLIYMLLLWAANDWPEIEIDPVPITPDDIEALILKVKERLTPEEIAHAEEVWETDEPWQRMSWGDERYFERNPR